MLVMLEPESTPLIGGDVMGGDHSVKTAPSLDLSAHKMRSGSYEPIADNDIGVICDG
jgi:hypothetical protein